MNMKEKEILHSLYLLTVSRYDHSARERRQPKKWESKMQNVASRIFESSILSVLSVFF